MGLPNIALHSHHNASVAVELGGDIITVIELERFVNLKNASHCFFQPIHVHDVILGEIYEYLKLTYGFTHYDKFVIGQGYKEVPQEWRNVIPANEYIVNEDHHPSHASSSFYQSPHNEALIISFDGGANDGFFRFFHGIKGQDLVDVKSFAIDLGSHYHLIGLFCEDIKHYDQLTAAGKVLGLQSYGNVREEWLQPLIDFFRSPIPYFSNLEQKKVTLSERIGIPFSEHNKLTGQDEYDFARTAQEAFEIIFFECADPVIRQYNLPVILTGGCALNITLNTRVKERYPDLDVFVAPNSSDCGITVGLLCSLVKPTKIIDVTYKGVGVLDRSLLMEYVNTYNARKATIDGIVQDLMNQRILGLIQGGSEHGPRALGNRSIICSPIPLDMKDTLNHKVKHREWFRPFAPIVRLEDVSEYFEWEGESRWMNFCPKVKDEWRDRLPAITHIDGTGRVQTVTKEQNPLIYDILTKFKEKTGVGVLVNTSFNVDRKPILSSYKDALKVFHETQLDRLYLDGYYFVK
jgi:carbamoyltransferase